MPGTQFTGQQSTLVVLTFFCSAMSLSLRTGHCELHTDFTIFRQQTPHA